MSAPLLAELVLRPDFKGDAIIVSNAISDPTYAPYCMRCDGFHRMQKVDDFYWRHSCGAEHDERPNIVAVIASSWERRA